MTIDSEMIPEQEENENNQAGYSRKLIENDGESFTSGLDQRLRERTERYDGEIDQAIKKYIAKSKKMLQKLDYKYEMYLFEEVQKNLTRQIARDLKKFNDEMSNHQREFILQEKMNISQNDEAQRVISEKSKQAQSLEQALCSYKEQVETLQGENDEARWRIKELTSEIEENEKLEKQRIAEIES